MIEISLPNFQCTGCGAIVPQRHPHRDPEKQRQLTTVPFDRLCDDCHPLLPHVDDE